MGAYNTVFGVGMIIAPLIGGAFMDFIGIEAVFYVGGAISLLGTVVFAAMMQGSARGRRPLMPNAVLLPGRNIAR